MQIEPRAALARDGAANHIDHTEYGATLALDLLHRAQRVERLAGLADGEVEGVRIDDGVLVAKLCRGLRIGRDARDLFDHARADTTGDGRAAATEQLDALVAAQLAGVEVQAAELRGSETFVQPSAQHPLDRLGLLVNLLEGEVGMLARAGEGQVHVDLRRGPLGRVGLQVLNLEGFRCEACDLTVLQVDDTVRVWCERALVGCGQHRAVADADDHRAAVSADHDLVRGVTMDNGDAVGAHHPEQGASHRAHQVADALQLVGNQRRQNLGIGVARELHSPRFEVGGDVVRVLDDAVVYQSQRAAGIGVRVRVQVVRLAVGGPTGVGDAGGGRASFRQGLRQARDPSCPLHDIQTVLALQREAGGVVAPVLQLSQPLQQDGLCLLLAGDRDDSTHVLLSYP